MSRNLHWFAPPATTHADPAIYAADLAPFGIRLAARRAASHVSYFVDDDGELVGEYGYISVSADRGTLVRPFLDAGDAAIVRLLTVAEYGFTRKPSKAAGWGFYRGKGRSWWLTTICLRVSGGEELAIRELVAATPYTLGHERWLEARVVDVDAPIGYSPVEYP